MNSFAWVGVHDLKDLYDLQDLYNVRVVYHPFFGGDIFLVLIIALACRVGLSECHVCMM